MFVRFLGSTKTLDCTCRRGAGSGRCGVGPHQPARRGPRRRQRAVGILALTRLRVIAPGYLRKNRRYAIFAIATLLPGVDP